MSTDNLYGQYNAFINAYRPVAMYPVDLSLLKTNQIAHPRDFEISQDEFFGELYVKRSQEGMITDALFQSPNIVLLIGEKGSGKTCMCGNVIRELRKRTPPGIKIISLDVRTENFSKPIPQLDANQIDIELLDRLREKYLHDVFPYNEVQIPDQRGPATEIPLLRLVAYMVDPNQDRPPGFETETLSLELRLLYDEYVKANPENNSMTYYDWLLKEYLREERIRKFIQNLVDKKLISLPFLMHATNALYRYERQCIWIDNVDTLSTPQQARIQTVIKRLTSSVSEIANIIVPVRDRNVFKQYEYDEFQAPPNYTYVRLFTETRDEVPALPLTKINVDEIRQIIRNRLDFALKRHTKLVSGEYPSVSGIPYTLTIERSTYENILALSDVILDVWETIQEPYLANNSIRVVLQHHCEFLASLLQAEIERHQRLSESRGRATPFPNFNAYGIRGVTTEYLAWIRRSYFGETTIGLYDVIADKNAWLQSPEERPGCTIEHLLVTATWNLTLRNPVRPHQYQAPRVKQVLEKLEGLGFKEDALLEIMSSLYHEDHIRTHFIEIQSLEGPLIVQKPQDIHNDFLIFVTLRGQSLARYVINTFGYVFECVLRYMRINQVADTSYFTALHKVDEKKAIDTMLPHLEQIAKMHIHALIKIRDAENPYIGPDWMAKYRKDFGIPLPDGHTAGEFVSSGRRALQFEMMVDGIIRFTKLQENVERLTSLLNTFKDAIKAISDYHHPEKSCIWDTPESEKGD